MKRVRLLLAVLLLCSPLAARAQGTYAPPSGTRNAPNGASSPATSQPYAQSAPSRSTSGNRNTGTGQSEGALGLTPQLQRELGITRQQ